MNTPDIVAAISPVIDALERLSVSYSVVGSVASSAHGIARATLDADVGVLKVQSGALDIDYMRRWAADIGVDDLLERAFRAAATPAV
jgi:hypothetical protein